MVKEAVCRAKQSSGEISAGDDNEDMQDLREDLHASGKCPTLAGLLPGVQGQVSAGADHYREVPEMREDLHIPFKRPPLAKILPRLQEEANLRAWHA